MDEPATVSARALERERRTRGERSAMSAWIEGTMVAGAADNDRRDIFDGHEPNLWRLHPDGPPIESAAIPSIIRGLHRWGDTTRRDRWLRELHRHDPSGALAAPLERELGLAK